MPIFYNQGAPTPTTKNSITSVATNYGARDYLLNLNLLPQYPQLSTSINGAPRIGEPFLDTLVNNGSNVVPIGLPLETNGILWKDMIIGVNTFQNTSPTANNLVDITLINTISNTDFPTADWPQGIQSYPTSANDDVAQYGIMGKTSEANFRRKNTIKNLYLDVTKQLDMAEFIDLNPLDVSQQISGYLDTYGGLNLGGSGDIQAANVIGSVLNGQGLGLAKGGIVTNFDIRSSLAGRVLGATGLINDTKLGMIGGQQLALALANNAAFNVEQELLGSLNVQNNILSLIKGDGWVGLRPSYKITIPRTGGGRALDTAGKILGFTIPRSYLDDAGSIFQTENNNSGNIERANAMILNTGKGQIQALLTNVRANQIGTNAGGTDDPSKSLFRSGYAPAFANNKGQVQITDALVYAFSEQGAKINLFSAADGVISDLSYLREEKVSEAGFKSPEEQLFVGHQGGFSYDNRNVSDIAFSWGTEKGGLVNSNSSGYEYSQINIDDINKKSLLSKTQKLFNSVGMKNIVTNKGDMNKHSTQIQTANGKGFSKGNAVMKADMFDKKIGRYMGAENKTAEETYCRSWTTLDRYDKVSKMVRSHGLWDSNYLPYRHKLDNSILDEYGFPKIAPYITDKPTDPKKFMFSIENLAWSDNIGDLPQCELGPGDLLSGKRGRIMWFPPYDIQFSENNSVSWEANNFIGRGESVYTYNNTERSGNLSFKIVVDHPSYVNSFSSRFGGGPDDHFVNSFWAGCIDPDSEWGKKLTVSQRSEVVPYDLTIPQKKVIPPETPPGELRVYFPNDNVVIEPLYENGLVKGTTTPIDYSINTDGLGQGLDWYMAKYTPGLHNDGTVGNGEGWPDRYNYGLNYSVSGTSSVGTNGEKLYGYFDPNTITFITKHLVELCPHCVATVKGAASAQGIIESNKKLARDRSKKILEDIKAKWWTGIKEGLLQKGLKVTDEDFNKRFKVSTDYTVIPADKTVSVTDTTTNKSYSVKESAAGCRVCTNAVCKGLSSKDCKALKDRICPTDSLGCKKDRYASISFKFEPNLAEQDIAEPAPVIQKRVKTINTEIRNKFYTECNYFEQLTDIDPFVFDSFREKIRYFHPAFHSTTPEGLNSRLTFLLQCTRQGKTFEEQGANNLAFGRPPVCILRIGDFYNTKIVIDNISIDYEPLVWDLNPEGVGVQPMIANVSMSFKFIGASSLMGPINKLQNALSFNYFANTQVYDVRADYLAKDGTTKDGYGNDIPAYNLVNGETNISNPDTKITTMDVEANTPLIDQEKAAEQSVSGVQNQTQSNTTTTVTAFDVINCFSIGGFDKFTENDSVLTLDMMFTKTTIVDKSALPLDGKSYKGYLYVVKPDNTQHVVGGLKLTPNDADTSRLITCGMKNSSEVNFDDEVNNVVVDVGPESPSITKTKIGFEVSKFDEPFKFILDSLAATGSIIKIEWLDFSSKTTCSFSNSIANN